MPVHQIRPIQTEARKKSSRFIEIGEEAYKQNTVYRPWSEIVQETIASESRQLATGKNRRPEHLRARRNQAAR